MHLQGPGGSSLNEQQSGFGFSATRAAAYYGNTGFSRHVVPITKEGQLIHLYLISFPTAPLSAPTGSVEGLRHQPEQKRPDVHLGLL